MRVSIYQPILLALLILVLPGNVWAGLSESLKVMSFNVRTPVDAAPGKRWEDRRAAMVTMILDVQPLLSVLRSSCRSRLIIWQLTFRLPLVRGGATRRRRR